MLIIISAIIFAAVGAFMIVRRKTPPARAALIAGLATVAAVLPHLGFAKNPGSFFPLFTVVLCGVYALFALGLNVVVGYAGLLDLGYVAFFLFGAYTGGWFMSDFLVNVNEDLNVHVLSPSLAAIPGVHLSFWMVFIIAGVTTTRPSLLCTGEVN